MTIRSESPKNTEFAVSKNLAKFSRSQNDVSVLNDNDYAMTSHDAWTDDVKEEGATLPSIITMTTESFLPKEGVGEEEKGGRVNGKFMDLFQQLILWKKTTFLLDNICFTQEMCDGLVENDLFDAEMMTEIMVRLFLNLPRSSLLTCKPLSSTTSVPNIRVHTLNKRKHNVIRAGIYGMEVRM